MGMFRQTIMTLLTISCLGGIIGICTLILRLLFKRRIPAAIFRICWIVMIFRLIVPFFFRTPFRLFNGFMAGNAMFYSISFNMTEEPLFWKAVFLIWLSVAIVLALAVCIIYILVSRHYTLSGKWIKSVSLDEMVNQLKLKQKVMMLKSANIDSPILVGVFHPKIVLPDRFHNDSQTVISVLFHEGIHIKRFDNLQKLIFLFCLCVHWFNPIIWICYFAFSKDIETSCDEAVIKVIGNGFRMQYANTLLGLAKSHSGLNSAIMVGFGKAFIKQRIFAIMNPKKHSKILTIIVTVFIISITILIASGPLKIEGKTPTNNMNQAKYQTVILSPPISKSQKSNFDQATIESSGPLPLPNYEDGSVTLALIDNR
ncbi:MAG TPA: hypothetical protein DC013_02155 [Ruminococcaceae bacterium]|jgi:beta-lactamase regulating signal transducer with metallopeptidase domain|nr:hypothetical protein [Oscillospiraceae bacterium]